MGEARRKKQLGIVPEPKKIKAHQSVPRPRRMSAAMLGVLMAALTSEYPSTRRFK